MKEREQTYSEVKKSKFLYYILEKIANNARNKFFNILKKKTRYSKKKL